VAELGVQSRQCLLLFRQALICLSFSGVLAHGHSWLARSRRRGNPASSGYPPGAGGRVQTPFELRNELKLRFHTKTPHRTKGDGRLTRRPDANKTIRFVAPAKEQLALVAENRFHWIPLVEVHEWRKASVTLRALARGYNSSRRSFFEIGVSRLVPVRKHLY
jgi:hypothetical protein